MTTASAAARAADALSDEETHSLWYWYRNAREWGKPFFWSLRYARKARQRFR